MSGDKQAVCRAVEIARCGGPAQVHAFARHLERLELVEASESMEVAMDAATAPPRVFHRLMYSMRDGTNPETVRALVAISRRWVNR